MSSCRNSVHRRLLSVKLQNFYLMEVIQCRVVDILSAVGCPVSIYKILSVGDLTGKKIVSDFTRDVMISEDKYKQLSNKLY